VCDVGTRVAALNLLVLVLHRLLPSHECDVLLVDRLVLVFGRHVSLLTRHVSLLKRLVSLLKRLVSLLKRLVSSLKRLVSLLHCPVLVVGPLLFTLHRHLSVINGDLTDLDPHRNSREAQESQGERRPR